MIRNLTQAAILSSALFFVGTASAAGFPAIPHPVDGYVISQEKNDCLMCHRKAASDKRQNGEIPTSHYDGDALQAPRQQCTMCHQPSKK